MKNYQNVRILHDSFCARKIIKNTLIFIFAREINKIPEFYMILIARKVPEFYVIIARKIVFPEFLGHVPHPTAPRLL